MNIEACVAVLLSLGLAFALGKKSEASKRAEAEAKGVREAISKANKVRERLKTDAKFAEKVRNAFTRKGD